jgi:hypothetical protein
MCCSKKEPTMRREVQLFDTVALLEDIHTEDVVYNAAR